MGKINFKVRTFEDTLDVAADRVEFLDVGARFYSGDRITSAFSRYLWIQEQAPAPEPVAPTEPVAPEPVPEPSADLVDAT